MGASDSTEADVYQTMMWDVYKQWLEEFDREAAIRRNLPRRERGRRFRSALMGLRARVRRPEDGAAQAPALPGAQQCA